MPPREQPPCPIESITREKPGLDPSDAQDIRVAGQRYRPALQRPPNRDLTPLLTVQQLAEHLAVSVAWVRKGILERTLPFTKIGRSVRFTLAQVEQILKAGERPPLRAAEDRPRGRGSARTKL